MKKALYIYLGICFLSISSCRDPETHYFIWNNITLSKLEYFPENGYVNYRPTNNTDFAPLSFGINLNIGSQIIANTYSPNFSLISSAYAMTVAEDVYILNDKITYIKIKTIENFDDSHLAGSEITEYFSTMYAGIFKPVNSMLSSFNSDRSKENLAINHIMFLTKNPTSQINQQFEVEVKFESGNSFTKLTDVIAIQ